MDAGNAGIGPGGNNLVARAKAILLTPRDEWPRIAAEADSPGDIFRRHVVPLAAIGPVASLIGGQVFGYGAFGFSYKPGLVAALGSAVVSYAITLIGIWVLSLIADFLAPKFGGESNRAQAFKLVAYGATASFLAGIFGLIPSLGVFGLLGLYSLYLFYTGSGPLMKVPADKTMAYTAVTVVAAIVLSLIVAPITAGVMALTGLSAMSSSSDSEAEITLPGGGTLNPGKAEDFARRMEDAASGKIKPVEAGKLAALLPGSLGGWNRTAIESTGVGQFGSTAEGRYELDGRQFTLRVVDMSAMGAIAGMGAAMGMEQSREDENGYERTTTVDGKLVTEAWRKDDNSGKFGTVIANRFMVEAEGQADSIDDLKAAVAAINANDLEDLSES